jgi:16S rRNA (cytosine967-C5)-methyltransferase
LIYQLVFGVLRWQGKIDWILRQVCQRPLDQCSLRTRFILRLGVFQLLFLTRIPPSAAVNEAVRLAKAGRASWTSGLVNAVLRNVIRRKDEIPYPAAGDPAAYLAVHHSHPLWLVQSWLQLWALEKTAALCQANNEIPPYVIRTNTLKISREDLAEQLRPSAKAVEATPYSPEGLKITDPRLPLIQMEAYQKGLFQIQDEASQMIAHLVQPEPGEDILDLCCGFGGKATHMAQRMGNRGRILALDNNPVKIKDLRQNARRLGVLTIRGMVGDALKADFPKGEIRRFDRILVDAPCSGWGVIRRNPDLKWRLRPEDAPRLARMQNKLLQNAGKWLKSKGILVYSTCTLNEEENEGVVELFLKDHPEFSMESARTFLPARAGEMVDERGFFKTWPPQQGTDGFFAARLRKGG